MENNLHITLTEFRNESRLLKQAKAISLNPAFEKVYIASLHAPDLKAHEKISEKISLKRIELLSRGSKKYLFLKPFRYFELFAKLFSEYRNKKITMINLHSIYLLPIGVVLSALFKAKLIYDTHELETETNGLKGVQQTLLKILEKCLIGFCDVVFVVSESIADWYEQAYKMKRPTVVLNTPSYRKLQRTNKFRELLKIQDDKLIFLYQGALFKGRGIELLLETFKKVDSNKVIVFMGYGSLVDQIVKEAEMNKQVYYFPAVSPNEVLEYTASADIGISLIENTCLSYYYCMPNKIFEYMMVGLPMLVSNMKEMNNFVKKYDVGRTVDITDINNIVSVINSINRDKLESMSKNSLEVAKMYCWEEQEKKMMARYSEILN